MLGLDQFQLSSPLGYDFDFAQQFQALTSSCRSTEYAFTSPTAYALNESVTSTTSQTSTTSPTPSCDAYYVTRQNDTCNSVARDYNVSTFALLSLNNFDRYCSDIPTDGSKICLPPVCAIYTWLADDTCTAVAFGNEISVTQLQSWNPNINMACGNTDRLNGTEICIG